MGGWRNVDVSEMFEGTLSENVPAEPITNRVSRNNSGSSSFLEQHFRASVSRMDLKLNHLHHVLLL